MKYKPRDVQTDEDTLMFRNSSCDLLYYFCTTTAAQCDSLEAFTGKKGREKKDRAP